eukprot:6518255-Heterocapsa_arctica.AAC.1
MWPGYSEESGTLLGIASVGTAPVTLASRAGHLEVVRLLCVPRSLGGPRGFGHPSRSPARDPRCAALLAALPVHTRAPGAGGCGCRCSCSRAASTCGSRGQNPCFTAAIAEPM